MKSGFVSVVGRTNAGKSTLVNSLIGEKIAIVSNKPQTTRSEEHTSELSHRHTSRMPSSA